MDLTTQARRSTVRLTTIGRKSGEPRTVTIWFVVTGPRTMRVQHVRGAEAHWYRNLCRNPAVTLDFGSGPVAATARPLTDRGEIDAVLQAIRRKHWLTAWILQRGGTEKAVAAEITLDEGPTG